MASERAIEILEYLDWWEYMLWRERNAQDPQVTWQEDLSFDRIAAMLGVDPPTLRPGDLCGSEELNVALYWPGEPPRFSAPADGSEGVRAEAETA